MFGDEKKDRIVIKGRQTRNERVASCDKDVKERELVPW